MLNPRQRVEMEKYQAIANFLRFENIDNNMTILEFKKLLQNKARKIWRHVNWFPEVE